MATVAPWALEVPSLERKEAALLSGCFGRKELAVVQWPREGAPLRPPSSLVLLLQQAALLAQLLAQAGAQVAA